MASWKDPVRRAIGAAGFEVSRRKSGGRSLFHSLGELISEQGVTSAVDVGAHQGAYASTLRSAGGFRGDLHSFEPSSANFAALSAAASSDPRWHVYRLAVGAERGTASLNIYKNAFFNSLLSSNSYAGQRFAESAVPDGTETVDVKPLDDLLESLVAADSKQRLLLKTDTQGFDLNVLIGAENLLKHVAVVQVELSIRQIYTGQPNASRVVTHLADRGFELREAFPVSADGTSLVEIDGIFVAL